MRVALNKMTVSYLGFRKKPTCLKQIIAALWFRVAEAGGERERLEVETGASAWSGSWGDRRDQGRQCVG